MPLTMLSQGLEAGGKIANYKSFRRWCNKKKINGYGSNLRNRSDGQEGSAIRGSY